MRDTPYNKVDGTIVYAGQLDAPMPSHPLPQPARTADDFTPEMFIAQRAPVPTAPEAYAKRILAISRNGEITTDADRYEALYVEQWDNGKGSEGGYCPAKERTEARTQRIIDQVRFAPNQAMLNKAFDASCYYSSELHYQLACMYGMKFARKAAQSMPTPEPRKQAEFAEFP